MYSLSPTYNWTLHKVVLGSDCMFSCMVIEFINYKCATFLFYKFIFYFSSLQLYIRAYLCLFARGIENVWTGPECGSNVERTRGI